MSVIDVLGSPVVDIGNGQDTILTYQPVTLSATPGYSSYRWQDGSTGTDYEIGSPGAAMYTVIVTGVNGCATTDSVYVAYDVPDIAISRLAAPVTSCTLGKNNPVSIEIVNNGFFRISNETITVSYAVNNGTPVVQNFTFSSGFQPGTSLVLTFGTGYDFSAPGSYQVDVTLEYAADQVLTNNSLSTAVNVWGLPAVDIGAGKDTIRTGLPFTLDAGTGFSSYLWQDNSAGTTFNVTQWGLHWVEVTNEHGCPARDSVYVLSLVSVEDLQAFPGKISFYPNPVQDFLHVIAEKDVPADFIIELYSLRGSLIFREDFKETRSVNKEINVRNLAPGVYFLKVTADKKSYTYKVIVSQ